MTDYVKLDQEAITRQAVAKLAELPGLLVTLLERITASVTRLDEEITRLDMLLSSEPVVDHVTDRSVDQSRRGVEG